jgi:hypothetical protein
LRTEGGISAKVVDLSVVYTFISAKIAHSDPLVALSAAIKWRFGAERGKLGI